MVAGRKVLGSRRGRDGGKGAKFSEVKPAVGTESSEKVPEGPQSRKWGDSSGRRGALPTQSVRRGRGQREVMQAPERRFQSDSNPRPKRTRAVPPGPATRPCLSLPSYPVSLRSLRCTPRYPKRCPIWRPSSPAPPAAEQRPRPPTNERSGGPRGARPRRVRRAAGVPRHVHKVSPAPPLPRAARVGDARGELQLPEGVRARCPTPSSCLNSEASWEMYFYLFAFVSLVGVKREPRGQRRHPLP